jgi:hypothetical protein
MEAGEPPNGDPPTGTVSMLAGVIVEFPFRVRLVSALLVTLPPVWGLLRGILLVRSLLSGLLSLSLTLLPLLPILVLFLLSHVCSFGLLNGR